MYTAEIESGWEVGLGDDIASKMRNNNSRFEAADNSEAIEILTEEHIEYRWREGSKDCWRISVGLSKDLKWIKVRGQADF